MYQHYRMTSMHLKSIKHKNIAVKWYSCKIICLTNSSQIDIANLFILLQKTPWVSGLEQVAPLAVVKADKTEQFTEWNWKYQGPTKFGQITRDK